MQAWRDGTSVHAPAGIDPNDLAISEHWGVVLNRRKTKTPSVQFIRSHPRTSGL